MSLLASQWSMCMPTTSSLLEKSGDCSAALGVFQSECLSHGLLLHDIHHVKSELECLGSILYYHQKLWLHKPRR
eukprot:9289932-Karenia_brevis.AAC.1